MTQAQEEVLLAELEGPNGTAEIFEVPVEGGEALETEYVVVFKGERRSAPSFGEAHILANEMTGEAAR